MNLIHDAWIECLALASFKSRTHVEEKFSHIPHTQLAYSHSEHLHSAIAYLYKETCMPILLHTREYEGVTRNNLLYTAQSIRIATAHAICIRIVDVELPYPYPFIKFQQDIKNIHGVFEDEVLEKAAINCVIVIGM